MARTLPSPAAPTERGVHENRPYLLWLPGSPPPWPGMVIVHGAGSQKENHGDFGRACAAAGWAALAYDQRGHGDSAEEMSGRAIADAVAMCRFLADREGVDADRVCVRGSSMGGFVAIHAAAISEAIAGVGEHDLRDAVELIGARPLLLIHAEGDEQVPHELSAELHRRAAPVKKLIVLPGGHHRSAQHDPELHGLALRWLARNLR
jgi:uncharacterized protein